MANTSNSSYIVFNSAKIRAVLVSIAIIFSAIAFIAAIQLVMPSQTVETQTFVVPTPISVSFEKGPSVSSAQQEMNAYKQYVYSIADTDGNRINDILDNQLLTTPANTRIHIIVETLGEQSPEVIENFVAMGGEVLSIYEVGFVGFAGVIDAGLVKSFMENNVKARFVDPDLPLQKYMNVATQLTQVRNYVWDTLGYKGDPQSAIAVIDTGLDDSHPMLQGFSDKGFGTSKIVGWKDPTPDASTSPQDFGSHGSHVGGIVAGKFYDSSAGSGLVKTTYGFTYTPTSGSISGEYDLEALEVTLTGTVTMTSRYKTGVTGASVTSLKLVNPSGTVVASDTTASSGQFDITYSATTTGTYKVRYGLSISTNAKLDFYTTHTYPFADVGDGKLRFSGVAPDVSLVGCKAFDNSGLGATQYLLDCLSWVQANAPAYHIQIASMSLGFSGTVSSVETAVTNLANAGVLSVIAAGNDGQGSGNQIFTPGSNPYALTVGSVGDNNVIASYSSEGPGTVSGYTKPDVTAPGGVTAEGAILSVDSNDQDADGAFTDAVASDMTSMQGTSMATPHVSGATHLVIHALGGYSGYWNTWTDKSKPMKLKQLMMMTAWEKHANSQGAKDTVEGSGRINPGAAIEAAKNTYAVNSTANGSFSSAATGTKVWARSVSLTSGTSYTFQLTVPSGQNFDLFLYSPNADTYGQPQIAAKSTSTTTGAAETITFTPSSSGIYYIVVKTVQDASGSWTLTSSSTTGGGGGGGNQLTSGVPVTDSLTSTNLKDDWTIAVDANAQSMRIVLDSGTNDFDVYQRFGSAVSDCTTSQPITCSGYDNRGYTSGGEDITISSPAQGTHYISVVAYSGTGSYTLTVTVTYATPDTTPPTVSITNPANGATVSGIVTISVSATDNSGTISSYAIKIDGVTVANSNSYSWDTTTYSNAQHTIVAEARDPSNNLGTASITVTVNNVAPTTKYYLQFDGYSFNIAGEVAVKVNGNTINWEAQGLGGSASWKTYSFDITSLVTNPNRITATFQDLLAYTNQIRNVIFKKDTTTLVTFQTSAAELYKPVSFYTYTGASGTPSFSGTTYTSSSSYRNEYFWFYFKAAGTVTFSVSWSGTADMDFYFYNSAGTQLGSSVGTTNPETKSFSITAAGVYYLRVYEYSGASTQAFTLSVTHP